MGEKKPDFHQRRGPAGRVGPMPAEKAKNFKGTAKKLLDYIKPYKILMLVAFLFAVISTVFNIFGPRKIGDAANEISYGLRAKIMGTGGIDFDSIGRIIEILSALYLTATLFSIMQGFIMTHVSQKISYNLRRELSEKINRMPMKYFDSKTHGEILSRITNDIDTLGQNLNQSISQVITSFVTVIGILIMMLTISIPMTVAALIIIPVSGGLMVFIIKKSQKYFIQQQSILGEINGQVEETFSGHNIIKAFNMEESITEDFDGKNAKLCEAAWRSQFISGIMHPVINFVGNLGHVIVSLFGGFLVIRKALEVGYILSFISYVRNFTQPIAQIAQISSLLQSIAAAAERVFEFLGEEEEEQAPSEKCALSTADVTGRVVFENVHFGYSTDNIIINNFNAKVEPGQKIAIVGPTGAGKTTIVKLLMRFYDVNSGAITLDGYNIKSFDRNELRTAFGMVLQDTWLFKGTIMENIRYGNLSATDEEVIRAAKAAHAHHFIKMLPRGYNMELNEEANNVSGGQKQLLTIARAILANNKVLILDEATSSVDTRTEIRIQKAMDYLMEGRTSFIIAHRLSTIRNADLILVMKDGDIVEQGRHDELIEKSGFYAELYNSQFDKAS